MYKLEPDTDKKVHTDREVEKKRQHLRMQVGIHSPTKGHTGICCCKLHSRKYIQTETNRETIGIYGQKQECKQTHIELKMQETYMYMTRHTRY
jgi:hypothetical protein